MLWNKQNKFHGTLIKWKKRATKIVTTCKAKYPKRRTCHQMRQVALHFMTLAVVCPSPAIRKPSPFQVPHLLAMSMVMLHVSWLNAFHKITFNGFQLTKCICGHEDTTVSSTRVAAVSKRRGSASYIAGRLLNFSFWLHEFTVKTKD